MESIIIALEARTLEHPDKLLYAFLDIDGNIQESYTYHQFSLRTRSIAGYIYKNHKLKAGDRIILAYPPGLEMICAFFACVRLGLIPVPVYPPSNQGFNASVQKMNFIAQDCGAVAVLTNRSYYWSIKLNLTRKNITSFSFKSDLVSKLKWIVSNDAKSNEETELPDSHSDILFLQYTSGSTNDPKGVIVTHSNIIHNCNNVVDHLPIGVSWLPQYHDMGLIGYYLFFALKGGTTYGFSPIDFIQRPALWLETISKYGGTASSAPNFAFEYCLRPGKISEETLRNLDLSSLRFLMTAAEPVRTGIYQDFINKFKPYGLNHESFFSAYGLAEFTLAVSNYGRKINSFDTNLLLENEVKINYNDSNNRATSLLSCGRPLGDTEIVIIDISGVPKEAGEGKVGEIWLKGTSKCSGYWNRVDLSNEVFEAKINNIEGTWLRTGDLGFLYENELYICGRTKDMIIVRGLNYYPQDIETLVEQDSAIRKGCVASFSVDRNGKEELIVVAELRNNKKKGDIAHINQMITQYLGISVDRFIFIPARTISKTSSGKMMRFKVKKDYLENRLTIIDQKTIESEMLIEGSLDSVSQTKEKKSLFETYGLSGTENNSLGDAGFDSLKLAEFAQDLKILLTDEGFDDLSQEIDLRLVQKIAVSELNEILTDIQNAAPHARYRFKRSFARFQEEFTRMEQEMMSKDACNSTLFTEDLSIQSYSKTGHILLTGGTGFFGPFLIKSLLEQNEEDLYILVRSRDTEQGMNRLREAFSQITVESEIQDKFDKRIIPVCGDLARPKLGLTEEVWDFLSKNIHTIYHNGAQVNYLLDYESMRNINISGTNEIVKLAQSFRSKILNHISTTFIFGWSVKSTLFETDSNQEMSLLDFGYSQSKWVSEQIVKNAMKSGLQARIFRPALISPSISGEGFNFDISIRLLAFMIKHGIGTSAQNQVSFTPADLGANNIVAISNIDESVGNVFHVTRDSFSNMQDVTDLLSEMTGIPFQNFPLVDFVPEVVCRCGKDDLLFPLLNFLVRSVDNISSMEFKRYDNSNYRKYFQYSPWGKEDAPLSDVVKGILLFMQKEGIVKSEKIVGYE